MFTLLKPGVYSFKLSREHFCFNPEKPLQLSPESSNKDFSTELESQKNFLKALFDGNKDSPPIIFPQYNSKESTNNDESLPLGPLPFQRDSFLPFLSIHSPPGYPCNCTANYRWTIVPTAFERFEVKENYDIKYLKDMIAVSHKIARVYPSIPNKVATIWNEHKFTTEELQKEFVPFKEVNLGETLSYELFNMRKKFESYRDNTLKKYYKVRGIFFVGQLNYCIAAQISEFGSDEINTDKVFGEILVRHDAELNKYHQQGFKFETEFDFN